MFSTDRDTSRQVFIAAWGKVQAGQPLEPIEAQIVDILRLHPEYQSFLEDTEEALERDFSPELGETNPFLHLALHLGIQEQVSIDQPQGIRKLYQRLLSRTQDLHEAEHRIMECLAHAIWRLQRDQKPFNAKAYLKCIKRAIGEE